MEASRVGPPWSSRDPTRPAGIPVPTAYPYDYLLDKGSTTVSNFAKTKFKEKRKTYNGRSVLPAVLTLSSRIRKCAAAEQCQFAMRDVIETVGTSAYI